jgi:hypothetical protein
MLRSSWNYDLWSSSTYCLTFGDQTPLLRTLSGVDWPSHLTLAGANYRLSWRRGELVADVNATINCNGNVMVTVTDPVVGFDASKNRSSLLLIKQPISADFECRLPDSDKIIRSSEKLGMALNLIVNIVGWISLVATIGLLFVDINLTQQFVDFLRMVKPLARLKYINASFGGLVEAFLATYQNPFQISTFTRTNSNVRLMIDSRAKLSRYFLPVFIFSTIPDKFVLYAVISV